MNLRSHGKVDPKVIAIIAVIVILAGIAVWLNLGGNSAPEGVGQSYYLDLGTGTVFTARSALPPVEAPSNADNPGADPAGVAAHMFSCGDCGEDRFIGFVERYTPEAKEVYLQLDEGGPQAEQARQIITDNHYLARYEQGTPTEQIEWVLAESPEGRRVRQAAADRCDGGTARRCRPIDE